MKREIICEALNMIDDTYIKEIVENPRSDAMASSERNSMMKGSYCTKRTKKFIALGVAACVLLSAIAAASAADFWGIRELSEKSGTELPAQAEEYIVPQSSTAQNGAVSCSITESLYAGGQMTVVVKVNCNEDYILVPDDSSAGDVASSIGINSDKTLAEYAAEQNRTLLFVTAALQNNRTFGGGYRHDEYVSDTQRVILVNAEVRSDNIPDKGICTVYVKNTAAETERLELGYTVTKAPETTDVFVPIDPEAVVGVKVGKAVVTESVRGYKILIELTVTDFEAFDPMEIRCKELTIWGGSVYDNGDQWHIEWYDGQGTLTDTMTLMIYNVENGDFIGEVVFKKCAS